MLNSLTRRFSLRLPATEKHLPEFSVTGQMGLKSQEGDGERRFLLCHDTGNESSPDVHATNGGMLLAETSPFRLRETPPHY